MAGANKYLELVLALSRTSCLAIAVVALVVGIPKQIIFRAFGYASFALAVQAAVCTVELAVQLDRRLYGQPPLPADVSVCWALVGFEMVMACLTWGASSAAVGVAISAGHFELCKGPDCAHYLPFSGLAWAAGVLTVVSFLCTYWMLGCRVHQPQE